MERHCENARAVVDLLAGHPAVDRVLYPQLPDHPGHRGCGRPDARLRRDGLVHRCAPDGMRRCAIADATRTVHPRRVPRCRREPDRAPRRDDPRLGGRVPPRGPRQPHPALGRASRMPPISLPTSSRRARHDRDLRPFSSSVPTRTLGPTRATRPFRPHEPRSGDRRTNSRHDHRPASESIATDRDRRQSPPGDAHRGRLGTQPRVASSAPCCRCCVPPAAPGSVGRGTAPTTPIEPFHVDGHRSPPRADQRRDEIELYYEGFSNDALVAAVPRCVARVDLRQRNRWDAYRRRERTVRSDALPTSPRPDADRVDPRLPAPARARTCCAGDAQRRHDRLLPPHPLPPVRTVLPPPVA